MIGDLVKSLTINGNEYPIRTDFRDVLRIITAFDDPDLEDVEKVYVCLFILYEDFYAIPRKDYEAAYRAAIDFIDHVTADSDTPRRSARILDWEQDEALIFPAVNKVAGFETRSAKYVHWWTFLGFYMEISDGVLSNVLNLRMKKARGKKLEKWEQEFWNANKGICVLKEKLSEEEQERKNKLNALLG